MIWTLVSSGIAMVFGLTASAELVRFEGSQPGTLPSGWSATMTHSGEPARWQIVRDETAPSRPCVLAQTSQGATAGRFPLAVWEKAQVRDGEVSVAFKTVSGTVDQAAGVVWRYQDENDYYVVRANALENNVVFYKVERGIRVSIAPEGMPSRAYGVKRPVPKRRWNELRVVFKSTSFKVFFNREYLFEVEDRTFMNAGKTGLWTKADSVTYFDEFSVSGN
jgi:hypothetical protein